MRICEARIEPEEADPMGRTDDEQLARPKFSSLLVRFFADALARAAIDNCCDGRRKLEALTAWNRQAQTIGADMRKVQVFKWGIDDDRKPVRMSDGFAIFHQFTNERECTGLGETFDRVVAIVERQNGNVETVSHMLIQFVEPVFGDSAVKLHVCAGQHAEDLIEVRPL